MKRVCQKCNAILDDAAKFCYCCGAPVPAQENEETGLLTDYVEETGLLNSDDRETGELYPEDMPEYMSRQVSAQQTDVQNIQQASPKMNETEFYKKFVPQKTKGWTTAAGVICLVSGVISIPLLFLGNLLAFIDIVFYVLMGILILTIKKWGLPLAVTIYSGVFSVISLAIFGIPSGAAVLVVGIFATIYLKKANDAYKLYCSSGVLPEKPIE